MSSYADVAASGPSQSAEEARAPPIPQVEHTEDSTASLIDVDSPHISSVPSDFDTQSVKTSTQAERIEREEELERQIEEAKKHAESAKHKSKAKAQKASDKLRKNSDNPVVLGNFVTVGILGAVLGVGAYRKYTAGDLTWKVAGAWAGVVGLFAVGDYYVSQYLFQKYPPKQ